MAKKQTRRSISVSRVTYERLKSYCETQGISMSQFVETRVGDFLGRTDTAISHHPSQPRISPKKEGPLQPDPDIKLTADQIFTF
jgi:hypothetical protein